MNALLEAYLGKWEDTREVRDAYAAYVAGQRLAKDDNVLPPDRFLLSWCDHRIASDSPHDRLATYLEWNGILGYTDTIFSIATGEV